ncbi:MAG: hypothetical protein LBD97_10510 [Bifidobacteriaceae bacterium]|nr:hypothetical protein [Bifidobacteriaceae bacterium]
MIGAITAAAVVATGAGIWAITFFGDASGSATPEGAVERLLAGAAGFDWTKAGGAVPPSERALASSWATWTAGIAGEILDATQDPATNDALTKITDALDIEFTDLELSSEELVPGVERTTVEGGSVTIDGDAARIAEGLMDLTAVVGDVSRFGQALGTGSVSESEIRLFLDSILPVTKDLDDLLEMANLRELFFVTVHEEGEWYTSLTMTLAQYAFEAAGLDDSDLGEPIPADEMLGAKSPAEAVTKFQEAIAETAATGDIRELAKALPVAESRLFAVYGPALIDPDMLEEALSGLEISEMSGTTLDTSGSTATVALDSLVAEFSSGALEYAREDATWTISLTAGSASAEFVLKQPDSQTIELSAILGDDPDAGFAGSLAIPDPGELKLVLEALGEQAVIEWDGECLFASVPGEEDEELCEPELADLAAEAGLSDFSAFPDLANVLSLSAIKGADDKWYLSLVGSPVLLGGVACVGLVAALSSPSGFGFPGVQTT